MKKILILGVNGFIGSALSEALLERGDFLIYGMDMESHKLENCLDRPLFHFFEGDITINKEWIAYHIKKCDIVIPLVAIATPILYVKEPLKVFELDFEANLEIVRLCVHHKKRLLFPSTSEVYGMCTDASFDEETSSLITGPISKQRWIYAASKQLLDRVIYAYGVHENLDYTLFRPFNWIGPKLDHIMSAKEGASRVLTQFIFDAIFKKEIRLVDGGHQRRCFTDIDDGINALLKIIDNRDGLSSQRIFNIGNPKEDYSVRELAHLVVQILSEFEGFKDALAAVNIVDVTARDHYGDFYQDVERRTPSIENAKKYLDWTPFIDVSTSLRKTLTYHIAHLGESR